MLVATETDVSTLGHMSEVGGPELVGDRIRRRREALGLSASRFAELAGIDRDTLARLEDGVGKTRGTTIAVVERTLDDLEDEAGEGEPPARNHNRPEPAVVRFVVKGVYGAESLVVEGPVENIAELERSVDRIMRRLAGAEQEGATDE